MIEYENLKKVNKQFLREFKDSFGEMLKSGWYILGKKVEMFEQEFARYLDTNYCIGVASGFDALTISLKSFNFDPGSEVIVPSNTHITGILSIIQCNLKPVLVEPDIKTYTIDPTKIAEQITSRTKAISITHLYGKVCDMDPIIKLVKKYDLKLIEDCAQAHGASYFDKKAGTFGDYGAFSFYPTKNLGALGDGGAIVCADEKQTRLIKMLRNYGSVEKYHNEVVGYNSRLDEIQAGFLSIKLKFLDKINQHKRKLAKIYQDHLKEDFVKPVMENGYYDIFHIYAVRHPQRDKVRNYLLKNKIKTEVHYPIPPHKQKALQGVFKDEYPISELIHESILSLPLSFGHTEKDIFKVVEILNKF